MRCSLWWNCRLDAHGRRAPDSWEAVGTLSQQLIKEWQDCTRSRKKRKVDLATSEGAQAAGSSAEEGRPAREDDDAQSPPPSELVQVASSTLAPAHGENASCSGRAAPLEDCSTSFISSPSHLYFPALVCHHSAPSRGLVQEDFLTSSPSDKRRTPTTPSRLFLRPVPDRAGGSGSQLGRATSTNPLSTPSSTSPARRFLFPSSSRSHFFSALSSSSSSPPTTPPPICSTPPAAERPSKMSSVPSTPRPKVNPTARPTPGRSGHTPQTRLFATPSRPTSRPLSKTPSSSSSFSSFQRTPTSLADGLSRPKLAHLHSGASSTGFVGELSKRGLEAVRSAWEEDGDIWTSAAGET